MSNVEGMYSVFYKKTERRETILRNSAVSCSIFFGSLFKPREVSYEVSAEVYPPWRVFNLIEMETCLIPSIICPLPGALHQKSDT
ncbi:MAG: hypothetical protein JSW26_00210 [Desulfobacterales bacterium]|nr:MAG: hypothetical protein JSW26_00210 [Desulfobacterales bacterium]